MKRPYEKPVLIRFGYLHIHAAASAVRPSYRTNRSDHRHSTQAHLVAGRTKSAGGGEADVGPVQCSVRLYFRVAHTFVRIAAPDSTV
jgi:hypothetical protein